MGWRISGCLEMEIAFLVLLVAWCCNGREMQSEALSHQQEEYTVRKSGIEINQ